MLLRAFLTSPHSDPLCGRSFTAFIFVEVYVANLLFCDNIEKLLNAKVKP